ncbi:unnamed protein product [Allacma fusca]|uniref:Uncharacterized protein n=1 Tax=Allacma fusca TaxID=39272 RepID=A0A8J2P3D2_9HEXA|nr:unnamed protein product [Allacma fusca]
MKDSSTPNNLVASFGTSPILCPHTAYAVGLVSLRYTVKDPNEELPLVPDKPDPSPSNPLPNLIFPHIKVPTLMFNLMMKKFTHKKTSDDILVFLGRFNKALEDKNIDVRFTTTIIDIKQDTELLIEVHRRHFYLGSMTARQTCKESTFKTLVPNGSNVELELVTFPRGEGSQENIIFVDNIYESLYAYIYKPKENLDGFVSHINTKLGKNGHDLKFLLRDDGKTLMDFKSYANKSGESVTLAAEVAEIFGFDETKFAVGIHTSDRVAIEDVMKN